MDYDLPSMPLSGKALRNWLSTSGSGLFTSGLTGSEALSMLRDMGGSIRTADFYDIRRYILARESFSENIRGVEFNQLVPMAQHDSEHGWNLEKPYLYKVKMIGIDPDTYKYKEGFVSVYSSKQMTQNEIISTANFLTVGFEAEYGIIASSYTVVDAKVDPEYLL